jgi:hypothetical protein
VNGPSTAREALIAETIGELARLLDRAEALQAAMAESRQGILDAHAQLAEQLAQVTASTEHAKVQAVKYILVRTEEAAQRSVDAQTRAMNDAARALFRSEIEPAMQRLATPLGQLVQRLSQRSDWLTHVATAVVSSALAGSFSAWLWTR